MHKMKLSHSTVSCYVFGKINNLEDNTQKIIVRKMIEGVRRLGPNQKDNRLPITRDLLCKILGLLSGQHFH